MKDWACVEDDKRNSIRVQVIVWHKGDALLTLGPGRYTGQGRYLRPVVKLWLTSSR